MDYRLANNDEIRFCCPFCDSVGKPPDTKFHLYVSLRTGDWICFRCNARGRALRGLPEEMKDIVMKVGVERGVFMQTRPTTNRDAQHIELPQNLTEIHDFGVKQLNFPPLKYIIYRVANHLQIWDFDWIMRNIPAGYIYFRMDDKENVYFLSRKSTGEVDFYITRNINQKYKIPYANKPLFKVGWWEINSTPQVLFIVEGVMDALIMYMRHHIPAVALLGKTLTNHQEQELLQSKKEIKNVIILLDRDAREEACMLEKRLKSIIPARVTRAIPEKSDPADSGGAFSSDNSLCLPRTKRRTAL